MVISKLRNLVADPDFPRQEQLENLRYYKYAATDKSLLTKYVLRHYWNWAVTLFPRWIAPNLITLTGLILMMINVVIILAVVPDLRYEQDTPQWIYFSFAAGLWLYSTLDNVDGKQARRTGTSSPLGELFDHGCDAINCTYVALLQAAALGVGHSIEAAILFLVTVVGFYLSTAEEYYTGVLYLGIVNGPTEGILVSCLAFVWSGFFGAGSWHIPLGDIDCLSWLAGILGNDTTGAQIFVWGMVFFFAFTHCPMCFYSIFKATSGKRLKQRLSIFMNVLYPITLYTLAVTLWLASPYSYVLKEEHYILFVVTVGILFGLMASNIILAHLTKSPFPSFAGILGTLWLLVSLIAVVPSITGWRIISSNMEHLALWILFGSSVIIYGVWASMVIDGFCRFLGISCLVIPTATTTASSSANVAEQDALLQAQEEGNNNTTPNNSQQQTNGYNTFA
ncbi:ethanolaminephosphotransferase 1 [Lichtheimia corymbifera JMRC:FSU:9682]|uniref:Ethanolaminephosphotransferase 1 n=1 Tax=Lichtheimia corymbifera JMRC:FSU:9682 TaxID=1263082 RepID=A0A068RMV1_9FUNG|nr:ethanolaminephosphotransferase 1 [Lichtheimia corymbifera JMRC:FSU:9682]